MLHIAHQHDSVFIHAAAADGLSVESVGKGTARGESIGIVITWIEINAVAGIVGVGAVICLGPMGLDSDSRHALGHIVVATLSKHAPARCIKIFLRAVTIGKVVTALFIGAE